jgi:hypothetical protein
VLLPRSFEHSKTSAHSRARLKHGWARARAGVFIQKRPRPLTPTACRPRRVRALEARRRAFRRKPCLVDGNSLSATQRGAIIATPIDSFAGKHAPNEVPMHDAAALIKDDAFITDFARFSEGILDEKFLRRKYRLAEVDWIRLGADDQLVEAIELEKIRRIRNGAAKREKAQQLVVKGPEILSGIAQDSTASARHRVDAIRTLDSMSDTGPEAAPPMDRFQITIVLSADERITIDKPYAKTINSDPNTQPRFNKSIKPDPQDIDAEIVDHDSETASFCFPAFAAKKNHGSGSGGEAW